MVRETEPRSYHLSEVDMSAGKCKIVDEGK